MQKSQWKIDFYPFSLPSSMTFVTLSTCGTYQIFWGRLGVLSPGLGGVFSSWGGAGWGVRGGLYKSLRTLMSSKTRRAYILVCIIVIVGKIKLIKEIRHFTKFYHSNSILKILVHIINRVWSSFHQEKNLN